MRWQISPEQPWGVFCDVLSSSNLAWFGSWDTEIHNQIDSAHWAYCTILDLNGLLRHLIYQLNLLESNQQSWPTCLLAASLVWHLTIIWQAQLIAATANADPSTSCQWRFNQDTPPRAPSATTAAVASSQLLVHDCNRLAPSLRSTSEEYRG